MHSIKPKCTVSFVVALGLIVGGCGQSPYSGKYERSNASAEIQGNHITVTFPSGITHSGKITKARAYRIVKEGDGYELEGTANVSTGGTTAFACKYSGPDNAIHYKASNERELILWRPKDTDAASSNTKPTVDPDPTGTWTAGDKNSVYSRLVVSSSGSFSFETVDFTGDIKGGYSGTWKMNGNSIRFEWGRGGADSGSCSGRKTGRNSLVFGSTTFSK
jgi:hypothetical protein